MDADGPPGVKEDAKETIEKNTGEKARGNPENLGARIRNAQNTSHHRETQPTITGSLSGVGAALRIGSELLAALIVGVGTGYFLDVWLGTRPWMMVVFFFLGSGAGILNVYRAASGFTFAGENAVKAQKNERHQGVRARDEHDKSGATERARRENATRRHKKAPPRES
ncbi:AtpZ/AtpI family protein [Varunaivibrio sulfuroxidans]|uniref:Putative F0F1-ATPase subunit (Ca2+/Mg2+ transporter) n=1 Tax=Varunaivibrio sulfuroxidans TaxID=1773489 RepID=A0A4R3J8C4_9PROT|nr:AtpZ/AtpI family protein [Varunaivibrio sulfuroxidans]TCS62209.1 putative F0F1-ATPase subunit (Ca2+/Mg2+ transporter) [Varunaivibrio sulfuroxidans]WES30634.1 AtpZ/AtpI family protein [Varunaivibrio sulfuroxidans]